MVNTHVVYQTCMRSLCYILYGWVTGFSVINFGKHLRHYKALDSIWWGAFLISSLAYGEQTPFTAMAAVPSDGVSVQSTEMELCQQWCWNSLGNLGWRARVVVFQHITFFTWRHFIPTNNKGTEGIIKIESASTLHWYNSHPARCSA